MRGLCQLNNNNAAAAASAVDGQLSSDKHAGRDELQTAISAHTSNTVAAGGMARLSEATCDSNSFGDLSKVIGSADSKAPAWEPSGASFGSYAKPSPTGLVLEPTADCSPMKKQLENVTGMNITETRPLLVSPAENTETHTSGALDAGGDITTSQGHVTPGFDLHFEASPSTQESMGMTEAMSQSKSPLGVLWRASVQETLQQEPMSSRAEILQNSEDVVADRNAEFAQALTPIFEKTSTVLLPTQQAGAITHEADEAEVPVQAQTLVFSTRPPSVETPRELEGAVSQKHVEPALLERCLASASVEPDTVPGQLNLGALDISLGNGSTLDADPLKETGCDTAFGVSEFSRGAQSIASVGTTVDEVTSHLLRAREKIEAIELEFEHVMRELVAYGQQEPAQFQPYTAFQPEYFSINTPSVGGPVGSFMSVPLSSDAATWK
jgi:hypothetical protein